MPLRYKIIEPDMHREEVVSIKCKGDGLLFAFQHTEGKKLPASQSQALRVVISAN